MEKRRGVEGREPERVIPPSAFRLVDPVSCIPDPRLLQLPTISIPIHPASTRRDGQETRESREPEGTTGPLASGSRLSILD